jgi:hypothetical protein
MLKKLSILAVCTITATATVMVASGTARMPTCGWYFVGWAYAYGCW